MDSSTSNSIQIVLLIILLIGSGFFSASETALMSLSKIKMRHMEEDGVKGAKLVSTLIEDSNRLLTSILIGNNIVNIAATSITTSLFTAMLGAQGVAIATGLMTVLVLIFGEITPKTISANNPEKASLVVAKPIKFFVTILTPIVWIFNIITKVIFKLFGVDDKGVKPFITEEELKTMVNVSHEEGLLEMEEREIINNVFEFGDMQAKEAMVQRLDIVAIDMEDSYEEIIDLFKTEKLSRMPVYEETIDDIIGILNIKDIIFLSDEEIENFDIKKYMREAFFTYEFKKITQLLEEMKKDKSQMAIVVDEYGGTAGLITIEDLVEVIVGDIEDEYDEEEEQIVTDADGSYIIEGQADLEDVEAKLGIEFECEDIDTLSGFMIYKLGKIPDDGENFEVEYKGYIFRTLDVRGRMILKVKVEKTSQGQHA